MRVGTPGFVGDRLREAREARGLSVPSLAALVGVSPQIIYAYERDAKTPSPEIMKKIADKLGFPEHFFTMRCPESDEAPVFCRSLAATSQASRDMAASHLKFVMRVTDVLRDVVPFVPVNLPAINPPAHPNEIPTRDIEDIAQRVRKHWGLGNGPIGNMVWLLENNGFIVLRREVGDECLDAYSRWRAVEGRPFIVLSTDKRSACRSRFDAAHELGHMVLHRNVPTKVFQDKPSFNLMESQAHRFAGAFLLPSAPFAAECYIPSLDLFRTMKGRWRVAIAAMIHRAHDLGMIEDDQMRRFYINLARRGWRPTEPLDDTLDPEEPRFMRRAMDAVVDGGHLSLQDFELRTGLKPLDVEIACGLVVGEMGAVADSFKFPALMTDAAKGPRFEDTPALPFRLAD